jgi:MFS family permease
MRTPLPEIGFDETRPILDDPRPDADAMPGETLSWRARGVVLGAFAAQVGLGLIYVRAPLFKHIVEEFGWSRGDFVAAAAVTNFVIAGLSPIVGWLTDRFGARAVVSATLAWSGLLFALFAELQSYAQLVALHVGFGFLVVGAGDIVVGSAVSQWLRERRGIALGLVYCGSNFGGLLASFAVPSLLEQGYGWRGSLRATGLFAVLVLLPIAALGIRNAARAEPATPAVSSAPAAPQAGLTLREALRTRELWLLWASLFLFYFYYVGVQSHLVAYFTDLGIPEDRASYGYGASLAVGIAGKLGIGWIGDRWPAREAIRVNFALVFVASLLLLGVRISPLCLPAYLLIHGFAVSAQNVTYPLIVAHCFGTRHLAQIYGLLMLALAPGGSLGSVFAGYAFDWTGSYDLPFEAFAALNAIALVAVFWLRSRAELLALSPERIAT